MRIYRMLLKLRILGMRRYRCAVETDGDIGHLLRLANRVFSELGILGKRYLFTSAATVPRQRLFQ